MEVDPPLSVFKYRKQTASMLHLSKAGVVSDRGKGRTKTVMWVLER